MGKIAFVFAGQGAQYPGMGKEFYDNNDAARNIFDQVERLRQGTKEQCFFGTKEELSLTVNTQPCLFTVDLAIAEALKAEGVSPDAIAGFSLGEIPALIFSKMLTLEDGFAFVCKRGEAMHEAAMKHPGGMAAVLKLSAETVISLCDAEAGTFPVNFNSLEQTVVAGKKEAMPSFIKTVKEAGGMAIPLAVSGAFHSPFMKEASLELETFLENIPVQDAIYPVYANVNAKPYTKENFKERITKQIMSPVLWQATVEHMTEEGFDSFIEVGPGKTLSGLIKKIAPQASVYNVEKESDLHRVLEELK
ncbi:ACP S-malonyltransferase [Sinanaerobacter sp. ZZT-01]|uniref:ACP S-malonyltransferase n=1 Tax=Sinanaerobacter sp. ZZT-01 TaxID=3111540 RepID=UPI002D771BD7|nr:ACP S-malonyltransferase [Sinanaerobacter sp. ZZT-01]WRR92096.1 ACP S-malonyltransferase [Sinanaerobacter sp. ZZT-01]